MSSIRKYTTMINKLYPYLNIDKATPEFIQEIVTKARFTVEIKDITGRLYQTYTPQGFKSMITIELSNSRFNHLDTYISKTVELDSKQDLIKKEQQLIEAK